MKNEKRKKEGDTYQNWGSENFFCILVTTSRICMELNRSIIGKVIGLSRLI